MKNLTVNRLQKLGACPEAVAAFAAQTERDPVRLLREMIETKQHLDWANWLIVRLMSKRQAVQYAVYAASQVLDVFEQKYPTDKRPREAIEAARTWIKRPTKKSRDAAGASYAAYYAHYASYCAAYAAAYAARAAADVFYADTAYYAAIDAARAAANVAADAARTAANTDVWNFAQNAMLVKILKYGLKLLNRRSNE